MFLITGEKKPDFGNSNKSAKF